MEEKQMTISQILDLITTLSCVALVVIVAYYTKNKVEIDRKAAAGDKMAKAQKMVEQVVEPLVIQAEKDGGTGTEKFTQVLNAILLILDMAHLPHPTSEYLHGMIEKGVTVMKQTQGLIDTFDGKKITDVATKPEQKIVAKTETTANKEQ